MAEEPKVGNTLTMEDVEMIFEAFKKRSENFPDEDEKLTFALVMFNIGDRFAEVSCVNGEWKGLKKNVPPGEGLPTCPDGHPLTQGPPLVLGWFMGD